MLMMCCSTTVNIFASFCYKFIQVTTCKKIDILDLSLIKLLQNKTTRVQVLCPTLYKL